MKESNVATIFDVVNTDKCQDFKERTAHNLWWFELSTRSRLVLRCCSIIIHHRTPAKYQLCFNRGCE